MYMYKRDIKTELERFEHLGVVNMMVYLGYQVMGTVNETIKEPEDVEEACLVL